MVQKVEIVRGTTNVIQITVTDGYGNLRTLSSGEAILFGVKEKLTDENYIFVRAATAQDLGLYAVELAKEDTAERKLETYWYDVGLQSGDDYFNIIETSPFVITANVTKWGCNG